MPEHAAEQCLVIFEDRESRGIFRLLKRGFRHCYGIVVGHHATVSLDFLKGGMRVDTYPRSDRITMMAIFAALGASVISTEFKACRGLLRGVRPMTCVELVKRSVGIREFLPASPYSLFLCLLAATNWKERLTCGKI